MLYSPRMSSSPVARAADEIGGPARATSRRTAMHIAALIALSLVLSAPLLLHGAPDLANDVLQHMFWAKSFSAQLWHGDWYPRWFPESNAGLGSPAFFFYPPLPSYASALFSPLVAGNDPHGLWIAGYGLALGLVVSALTAYWWLRSLSGGAGSALFGAAIYTIAPYHLAINLYNRGASAEFWILAWLPCVMLSTESIVHKRRWAIAGLAVSYALAVLSHPTVALCFAAIPFAYAILFSARGERLIVAVKASAAMALGVGLAGALLVPALLDQAKTHAHLQTEGFADYRYWWLFSIRDQIAQAGAQQANVPLLLNFKVRILVITLTTLVLALAAYLILRLTGAPAARRRAGLFYAVVALASVYFMTEQSALFWRFIPVLKFVESPSRLNILIAVAASAAAALAFPYMWQRRARLLAVGIAGLLLAWIAADLWSAKWAFSAWRPIPPARAAFLQRMMATHKELFPWPWPITTPVAKVFDFPGFDQFIQQHPPRALSLEGVTVRAWEPRHILLNVDVPEDGLLTINYFYYSGWQAHVASGAALPITATPDGFMQVRIPKGRYDLELDLVKDAPERWGNGISLASLGVLAGVGVWASRGRRLGAQPR